MRRFWSAVREYLHATDKLLLFFWLTASALSLLFLLGLRHSELSSLGRMLSQGIAICIGLMAALILSRIDYNMLLKLWKLYTPLCVVLVLLTFVLGVVRGGDRAWLQVIVGGRLLSLQPSELLKISFITTLSLHISKVEGEINSLRNMLLLGLHGGAHILLIQMQDSGTALIFCIIFVIMLFCAGISWKYIAAAGAALVVSAPLLWTYVMSDYQKMRILVLFNPEQYVATAYQQLQSTIALGTGGLQGTGIFTGRHVPVPEVYNDFIFSFIGESTGFMGSIGVILLLLAIALKILYNSSQAKDTAGRMICVGVFAMLTGQIIVNVGMCLGLLPVIGVTLPLLSQGGTSVLALYCGLGLVLSTYRHSNTALFYEK